MKKVKPKVPKQPLDLSAVRRSSRVADKPLPNYKEVRKPSDFLTNGIPFLCLILAIVFW